MNDPVPQRAWWMWLLLKHKNIWLHCTAEGKRKKGPSSWTHFCQRHPANRWHWFQIKSHIWAERFLKARVLINAFFLSLYFQLSNLSPFLPFSFSIFRAMIFLKIETWGMCLLYSWSSLSSWCGRTVHHDLESSHRLWLIVVRIKTFRLNDRLTNCNGQCLLNTGAQDTGLNACLVLWNLHCNRFIFISLHCYEYFGEMICEVGKSHSGNQNMRCSFKAGSCYGLLNRGEYIVWQIHLQSES